MSRSQVDCYSGPRQANMACLGHGSSTTLCMGRANKDSMTVRLYRAWVGPKHQGVGCAVGPHAFCPTICRTQVVATWMNLATQ